ncbi:MAG: hypothetical protein ACPIOQ_74060, partial [Promethearchaeia archaeon]
LARSDRAPMSRVQLKRKELVPNHAIRHMIEAYLADRARGGEEPTTEPQHAAGGLQGHCPSCGTAFGGVATFCPACGDELPSAPTIASAAMPASGVRGAALQGGTRQQRWGWNQDGRPGPSSDRPLRQTAADSGASQQYDSTAFSINRPEEQTRGRSATYESYYDRRSLYDHFFGPCDVCGIACESPTSDTGKCAIRRFGFPLCWVGNDAICCNCAKNFKGKGSLDGTKWSRFGCRHCKDRRSHDYRCQAYQAKGMMNWSCKFCDRGKDAHFKGVYSKKLFCTDPRSLSPAPFKPYNDSFTATADDSFTATADAELVITILCASCGKHGAHGDIFCRGCGAC